MLIRCKYKAGRQIAERYETGTEQGAHRQQKTGFRAHQTAGGVGDQQPHKPKKPGKADACSGQQGGQKQKTISDRGHRKAKTLCGFLAQRQYIQLIAECHSKGK